MKFQLVSVLLIILLVFLKYYSTRPVYKNGDLVKITTKVYSEPIVYTSQQYLTLQKLKIYLPKYPEITYGDSVVVIGTVNGDKLNNPKLISIETEKRGILLNFRQKLISFYKSTLPEPYSSLVAGTVIGRKVFGRN